MTARLFYSFLIYPTVRNIYLLLARTLVYARSEVVCFESSLFFKLTVGFLFIESFKYFPCIVSITVSVRAKLQDGVKKCSMVKNFKLQHTWKKMSSMRLIPNAGMNQGVRMYPDFFLVLLEIVLICAKHRMEPRRTFKTEQIRSSTERRNLQVEAPRRT